MGWIIDNFQLVCIGAIAFVLLVGNWRSIAASVPWLANLAIPKKGDRDKREEVQDSLLDAAYGFDELGDKECANAARHLVAKLWEPHTHE